MSESGSRRRKAAGVLWHPQWRRGWRVKPRPLGCPSGYSVVAVDASGAEFGFGVQAGWPEQAEKMAHALLALLIEAGYAEPDDAGGATMKTNRKTEGDAMNWRKQMQEHVRDASEVATKIVTRLSSDSNREREEAALYVSDIDAAFDRVEQRIANARRLWDEHR